MHVQIVEGVEKSRLAVLLEHLGRIDDPREPWRVAFPLREVLFLAVWGTICDCDDDDRPGRRSASPANAEATGRGTRSGSAWRASGKRNRGRGAVGSGQRMATTSAWAARTPRTDWAARFRARISRG